MRGQSPKPFTSECLSRRGQSPKPFLKYAGTVPQAIYRQSPMNGKDTSTTILTAILVVALALLTLVGLVWGVVKLSEDSSSPVRALLPWSPR